MDARDKNFKDLPSGMNSDIICRVIYPDATYVYYFEDMLCREICTKELNAKTDNIKNNKRKSDNDINTKRKKPRL